MKRFTETTKWDDPWFMDLPGKYKNFWCFICDRCDCAGIWEPNMRLAVAQIGEPLELREIVRVFAGRIDQLEDGKLWITKFIEFQYGILSPDCKPHLPVLKRLKSLHLLERVSKGYQYPLNTLQEKEKEKEKVQEKEGGVRGGFRPITKYGLPLPHNCTINKFGEVLDYTGRAMDINQVRKANEYHEYQRQRKTKTRDQQTMAIHPN